ncbi:MAG: DMT family transporter [Alphaproteobacteria bacterium]|nr:DMT family transporter [Alphaproteobacteria bacterium]
MRFLLLLFAGLLLASPGWYFITIQLKYVSTIESLFYRFILAGFLLEIVRRFSNESPPLQMNLRLWILTSTQGILLFGLNFWCIYEASKHMISGLIPALPAIIFVPALFIERFIVQQKIPHIKIWGSAFALLGIFFLFFHEITTFDTSHLFGLMLVFFSIFFTLGGSEVAKHLTQVKKVPILWLTSRTLLMGGLFFLMIVMIGPGFSPLPNEGEFFVSLLYLIVFVTCLLYFLHMYMIKNFGVPSASFLWVLLPSACLFVSTLFEGYVWTTMTTAGLLCIILGAFLFYSQQMNLKQKLMQIR